MVQRFCKSKKSNNFKNRVLYNTESLNTNFNNRIVIEDKVLNTIIFHNPL